jgi:hypothetical protein
VTIYDYPRLCGGTFFTLVLQALRQRMRAREHYKGESDGLSDPDVLMGLIKVINPDFKEMDRKALKSKANEYKACKTSGGTYFPFGDTQEIRSFDDRVKTDYRTALNEMIGFVITYLDLGEVVGKSLLLVKGLIDLIQQDETIDGSEVFFIGPDGQKIKKTALGGLREICLPTERLDSSCEKSQELFSSCDFRRNLANHRRKSKCKRMQIRTVFISRPPVNGWKYPKNSTRIILAITTLSESATKLMVNVSARGTNSGSATATVTTVNSVALVTCSPLITRPKTRTAIPVLRWMRLKTRLLLLKVSSATRPSWTNSLRILMSLYTHISFEICEDGLTDAAYFNAVYKEAAELCANLCKEYKLDPMADGVIIGHYEGHKRGIASNHADPGHWFPKHGKSMDTFRAEVKKLLSVTEVTTTTDPKKLYRVQVGAYSVKANADAMLKKVKAAGFKDAFIKYS